MIPFGINFFANNPKPWISLFFTSAYSSIGLTDLVLKGISVSFI